MSLQLAQVVFAITTLSYCPMQVGSPALEKAKGFRAALETGEIECIVNSPARNGVPKRSMNHIYRFAGDSYMTVNQGDQDGVIVRAEDGTPDQRLRFGLVNSDGLWRHGEDSLRADLNSSKAPVVVAYDGRCLGIAPWRETRPLHDAFSQMGSDPREPVEYREEVDGSLVLVTARRAEGTRKWWIDTKKGWSIVRASSYDHDGKLLSESRSVLARFGEIWFPSEVTYFSSDFVGGAEPIERLEIHSAAFNSPGQPKLLTPVDIGIEPGVTINDLGDSPFPGAGSVAKLMGWDGERLVPIAEIERRMRSGELKPGPGVLRERERLHILAEQRKAARAAQGGRMSIPTITGEIPVEPPDSAWEAYTKKFIAEHLLDAAQKQKAMDILKDCQERGRDYLSKRKPEIDEIEKRSSELTKMRATDKEYRQKLEALRSDRDRLRKPIDDIFEEQLKPRLEKLPTRAQSEAAEAAKAAAPKK